MSRNAAQASQRLYGRLDANRLPDGKPIRYREDLSGLVKNGSGTPISSQNPKYRKDYAGIHSGQRLSPGTSAANTYDNPRQKNVGAPRECNAVSGVYNKNQPDHIANYQPGNNCSINIDIRTPSGQAHLIHALLSNDLEKANVILRMQECAPNKIPSTIYFTHVGIKDLFKPEGNAKLELRASAIQLHQHIGVGKRDYRNDVIKTLVQLNRPQAIKMALEFYNKHNLKLSLLAAVYFGHRGVMKILLENDADPNCTSEFGGMPPLHLAVWSGHRRCTQFLMNGSWADILQTDKSGKNVLDIAQLTGNIEMFATVLASDTDTQLRFSIQVLFQAIKTQNYEEVLRLLDYGIDTTKKHEGKTALEYGFDHRDESPDIWAALCLYCEPAESLQVRRESARPPTQKSEQKPEQTPEQNDASKMLNTLFSERPELFREFVKRNKQDLRYNNSQNQG